MARNDVCSADTQADDIATSRSLHNHQHDSLSTSEVIIIIIFIPQVVKKPGVKN